MRVISNEIKKLLNVKSVMMLALIFFIIWYIFLDFHIRVFPNGFPETPLVQYSEQWLEEYGITIEDDEMKDFKEKTLIVEKEADRYILSDSDFKKAAIESYKEYIDELEKRGFRDKEIESLSYKVMFSENSLDLFWELEARYSLIDRYSEKVEWMTDRGAESTQARADRVKEVIEGDDINSVLSYVTMKNYENLISNFSIIIIITIAFLISTIFIEDKKRRTNYLQYSSKIGRELTKKKIAAAVISAVIVVTVELGVFFIIYLQNNTLQFWNCSINSIFVDTTSWFNMTFGKYIILSVVLMYLLTFIVVCIAMFVSSKANSYVSLIGIQVPVLGALIMFTVNVGMNHLTTLRFPKYTLHGAYGLLIVASVILLGIIMKKEKVRDILD